MNANMNFEDFTDPVEYFIEEPIKIGLDPSRYQES